VPVARGSGGIPVRVLAAAATAVFRQYVVGDFTEEPDGGDLTGERQDEQQGSHRQCPADPRVCGQNRWKAAEAPDEGEAMDGRYMFPSFSADGKREPAEPPTPSPR
jgi:hypothetical protein